jgi:sugar (pentulose or hexulose) kinase
MYTVHSSTRSTIQSIDSRMEIIAGELQGVIKQSQEKDAVIASLNEESQRQMLNIQKQNDMIEKLQEELSQLNIQANIHQQAHSRMTIQSENSEAILEEKLAVIARNKERCQNKDRTIVSLRDRLTLTEKNLELLSCEKKKIENQLRVRVRNSKNSIKDTLC